MVSLCSGGWLFLIENIYRQKVISLRVVRVLPLRARLTSSLTSLHMILRTPPPTLFFFGCTAVVGNAGSMLAANIPPAFLKNVRIAG